MFWVIYYNLNESQPNLRVMSFCTILKFCQLFNNIISTANTIGKLVICGDFNTIQDEKTILSMNISTIRKHMKKI